MSKIIAAAEAEIAEVRERAAELQVTTGSLMQERTALAARARELLPKLDSLQANMLREVPTVQTMRSQTSEVIARKLTIQK